MIQSVEYIHISNFFNGADMVDVVETLRFLLSHPNPDDPLHGVAANLMKNNIEEFKKRAREHVERYATWEQLASLIQH